MGPVGVMHLVLKQMTEIGSINHDLRGCFSP